MQASANVKHFNQFQNLVVVHDSNENGRVDSSDKAIAQKDFTLNVLVDATQANGPRKEVHFKAGDEVPFQNYQFLLKSFRPQEAQRWAAAPMETRLSKTGEPILEMNPQALDILLKNKFKVETSLGGHAMIAFPGGKLAVDLHGTDYTADGVIRTQKAIVSTVANHPALVKIVTLENNGSTHVYYLDVQKKKLSESPDENISSSRPARNLIAPAIEKPAGIITRPLPD